MRSLVPPNVERLTPYVPGKPIEELERELGVRDAVKLASNENPLGPSPKAIAAVAAALHDAHRYPDASTFALREALARHHDVAMDELAVGNGSNELIDLLCRTFAWPGTHAIIGTPSFVCYRLGLLAANVPFTEVMLRDMLRFDVDDLLAAIRPETKLLFVCTPNNPTGAHLPAPELARLLREAPEDVLIVVDEAYFEFGDAPDFPNALTMRGLRERMVVLRTFSKAYGLAGLRVGYGVAPRAVVDYLNRVRAPFNVSSVAQVAARAALEDTEHVAKVVALNRAERGRLSKTIAGLGYRVAPSQANFILVEVGAAGRELYDTLLRRGVIVRPMPPPIDGWVRITVGTHDENDRLLAALRESA